MILAASALRETWGSGEDVLFLSPGVVADDLAAGRTPPGAVLPDPWSAPGKKEAAYAECQDAFEHFLGQATELLNALHRESHGSRYWRILIGPWLIRHLQLLRDRLELVRAALATHPSARAFRLSPEARAVPADTLEHARWISDDPYLFQIHSQVLETLDVPSAGPPVRCSRSPKDGLGDDSSGASVLKTAVAALTDKTAASFHEIGASAAETAALIGRLKASAVPAAPVKPVTAPPADARAREALGGWTGRTEFERVAARWLGRDLPRRFVEGYPSLLEAVRGWRPKAPRLIVSSDGWTYQEAFKAWAAASAELGARLVAVQHGGGYGMYARIWQEQWERSSTDSFWSWGWAESDGGHIRDVPSPLLSRSPRYEGGPDALLVVYEQPRYRYGFQTQPQCSEFPAYLEFRERFLRELPEAIRRSIVARLMRPDFGWGQAERLRRSFPDIRQETMGVALARRMARSRLILVDHPGTSLLEAFASGAPVLCFWEPSAWEFRPHAQRILDALADAGVYHPSAESAAATLVRAWPDVSGWWNAEKTRKACDLFRRHFARADRRWTQPWAERIRQELGR